MSNLRPKSKLLFLYFELAGYTIACLDSLMKNHDAEIHVIRYPVNPVAPFQFSIPEGIHLHERKEMSNEALIKLVEEIKPDLVYASGWSDKGYLAVCKHLRKRIPVVLTLDNPWLGTLKQRVAGIAGPLYLKRLFTHCWVPGEPNAKFARKLGFKNKQLITGLYSADVALFNSYYKQLIAEKQTRFPHRFLYVGRYTPLKGINELWEAFSNLPDADVKDWELWCLGIADSGSSFPVHPRIKDLGFVQPSELLPFLQQTSVFILPTHYEHWGVVVHELAAAGFPLVCSETTSAATAFLEEGINGYFTEAKSVASIATVLKKIIKHSDEELVQMGMNSHRIAQHITPETWSESLWNILKNN
jgi:glycosyltransferase involved in cell wall biosynthesis